MDKKLIIPINGKETFKSLSGFNLTDDSPDEHILAVASAVAGYNIRNTYRVVREEGNIFVMPLSMAASSGGGGGPAPAEPATNTGGNPPPPPPPSPKDVTSNINAIEVNYFLNDGSVSTYYFYGKQTLPPVGKSSSPVPIAAKIFFVRNDLVLNGVSDVTVTGSTQIQQPSIKSIPKSDTTSTMAIEMPNPSAVSVYFGFQEKAGIAQYDIVEKDTGVSFVKSGTVDLSSSSDVVTISTRGILLADGMDESKTYILTVKHTGSANPRIFDSGLEHRIYVGDVEIHRTADASQSVLEYVSNTAFTNSSFLDNGSRNSITGRTNYVEFYDVQTNQADGISAVFPVNAATINVRSVEIDNGRGFKRLNQFIDWITVTTDSAGHRQNVVLQFVPKQNAFIRITYDVFSYTLQRKIMLSQPKTIDGRHDRLTDLYVNNEGIFTEINANITATV